MTNNQGWTPARIYNVYRIAIACALLLLHYAPDTPLIGKHSPTLFQATLFVYLGLSLASATLDFRRQRRAFPGWAQPTALISDLIMLTLVVHAQGGLAGGLAVLLLVTVAAGNILLQGRLGFLIAALATLSAMFEQFYFSIQEQFDSPFLLTESGLLGIAFFMVSLIIQQIAQRLEQSEQIARSQRVAIERLEALNQQIVQRMRTGVMVFDDQYRILMSNHSANNLFDSPMLGKRLSQSLISRHERWQDNPMLPLASLRVSEQSPNLSPRFAKLDTGHENLTLLFLEDTSRVAQEAQQLNLASLGRLSATLAHEIRNPLSAINHATELLLDGEPTEEDRHLLSIIRNHVTRVNGIIHDVLDLSRRGKGNAERFALSTVLRPVFDNWSMKSPPPSIELTCGNEVEVRFDPNQLTQILDNLISNALKHGGDGIRIILSCGIHSRTGLPWLRVSDNGKGISADAALHLFEPFYTTASDGNGLGLYLCRELCQANQATLDLEDTETGASFVITFAHPHRQFQ
ncbi:sensor histidine kinase [Alcanivorax sediminis]|uniref:histidine kinase n=1 Tax=Alcanivorax sediminis TaxID=2663008 RepID=A0A6N7M3T8_9GAMM|nr:HAMP domain-containing sensor histidine kinase [Alcanivorax sediminis]MQX54840.1 sensor histidine kinase [Alcanivorax sediminis]